ncbi:MAG TPA: monofunctional biosynthetic peptidoglycan transglycosylase [Gemmatimonadales bacterium]
MRARLTRVVAALGVGLLIAIVTLVVATVATWPDVAALALTDPGFTAFIDRYQERRRTDTRLPALRWEPVADSLISVHLKRAVVSAEDMEFFNHEGFSTTEIRQAIREAIAERERPRGASTITQQLAKNLWLSSSRNPLRKLREVMLTRQLERSLDKRRILEVYLNVVEFGPGVYGAEAASRVYFGKPAADLTEYEAAMLAAGLPRPSRWHPGVTSRSYDAYVADILGRMERATFLWRYVDGPDGLPPQQ